MTLIRAFVGTVLLLSTPFTVHAWSCTTSSDCNKNRPPTASRRAFVLSQAVVVATFGTTRRDSAVAIENTATSRTGNQSTNNEKQRSGDENHENDDESDRKRREKEAERIAKETKQRLAAGRIGRI